MQKQIETFRRVQAEQEHPMLRGEGVSIDVYMFFAPIDIGEGGWQSLRTQGNHDRRENGADKRGLANSTKMWSSGHQMSQKGESLEMSQAGKVLIVEPQAEMSQRYPWDGRVKRRFQLNEAEVDALEHGAVLWLGSTAFMVEQLA